MNVKVRNIHTDEELEIIDIDEVPNYPEPITVYILSDGTRWNIEQLRGHWEFVRDEGAE